MKPAELDRDAIAHRIPHHGSMCLLDAVTQWDDDQIRCRALSHRHPDNPMRQDGRLGAATGIEYAAQAMAVHGALRRSRETAPKKGYITRVQKVELYCSRLDDAGEELLITATRLMGNEQIVRYGFAVRDGERLLLEGQATVMLDAG